MEWAKKSDPVAFADFVRKRATPWGEENRYQPMHRCVDHVIAIIVYEMQAKTDPAKSEPRRADLNLSQAEAIAWRQAQQKLRAQRAVRTLSLGLSAANAFTKRKVT